MCATTENHLSIQTPRLLLRPMTLDDAADLFLIRSDPEAVRYTPVLPDTSVEQTRDWIKELLTSSDSDLSFCIELRGAMPTPSSHTPAQGITLIPPPGGAVVHITGDSLPKVIGFLAAPRIPEIGYGINRHFWNKGYMTEVLKGFKTAYWDVFPEGYPGLKGENRDCLTAKTDARNAASQTVLRKCGFDWWREEEGEMKGEKITVVWYRVWRLTEREAREGKYDWFVVDEKIEDGEGVKEDERLEEIEGSEQGKRSEVGGWWMNFARKVLRYVRCSP